MPLIDRCASPPAPFAPALSLREARPAERKEIVARYPKSIPARPPHLLAARPDFLVISPAKTGTSWLWKHLNNPGVFVLPGKEARYFDKHWRERDFGWYLNQFLSGGPRIKGDVSPTYAWLPKYAIEVVRQMNPALKLVILARRPVEHAWSQLRHAFRYRTSVFAGCESTSLEAVPREIVLRHLLSDEALAASDYRALVLRWRRYFPAAQFHVRYFEDAMEHPRDYLRDLYRFLGVTDTVSVPDAELREGVNVGIAAEPPAWVQAVLAELYSARQPVIEQFLAASFGLRPVWEPVAAASGKAIELQQRPDGWKIYLQQGIFHARNLDGGRPALRRDYLGDLLHELEPPCDGSADPEDLRMTDIMASLLQR